jgi:hypothetical protein
MWRELITSVAKDTDYTYEFAPPATYFQLDRLEQIFAAKLPDALRRLLLESNGVRQILHYNKERVPMGQILWNADTIQRNNRKMRTDLAYRDFYLPFDDLLFFASPATEGIQFALQIHDNHATETVIAWSPSDDSRTEKATTIKEFIEGWLSGKLEV